MILSLAVLACLSLLPLYRSGLGNRIYYFETRSCYVVQSDLELLIILPQLSATSMLGLKDYVFMNAYSATSFSLKILKGLVHYFATIVR